MEVSHGEGVASRTGLSPSMYQAVIDWGDGNESQGVITAGTSGFVVTSSNVFTTAGALTVTVTITDPSGASIAATGTATVKGIVVTPQTINQIAGRKRGRESLPIKTCQFLRTSARKTNAIMQIYK